jgi:hypothetical protein
MSKTKKKPKQKKPSRHEIAVTKSDLSKDVEVIKKDVVKINRHKRNVLHEVWPEILMHSVSQAESAIFRSVGPYGEGLTPKEVEELKEIRKELRDVMNRLSLIYFRLKF